MGHRHQHRVGLGADDSGFGDHCVRVVLVAARGDGGRGAGRDANATHGTAGWTDFPITHSANRAVVGQLSTKLRNWLLSPVPRRFPPRKDPAARRH